ncbi:MAG: hypothetical protein R2825_02550 [Saprospiraceae bacterium]
MELPLVSAETNGTSPFSLKEKVPNEGLNPASGGHLGYIPRGGIFPTALGDYLAAVSNEYAGIFYGGLQC